MQSDGTAVSTLQVIENTASHVLTCDLEGLEQHGYTVEWTLPLKPNGEEPPGVTVNGKTLQFSQFLKEQNGRYTCTIAGISTSMTLNVQGMYM